MNHLVKSTVATVAALALLVPAAVAAERQDDRAGVRGPGASEMALPGDTPVPFWPHETGALVGTSETYTQMREDGSYVDPSHGRRVFAAAATVRPDDRAGRREVPLEPVETPVSGAVPASRGQILAQERGRRHDARLFSPSGSTAILVASPQGRFDFADAGIGAAALAGVLAAALVGMLAVRRGRELRHA